MGRIIDRRRVMGGGNDIDWSVEYLTFKALESGTFQFTNAVEYSLNNGAWTSLAASTDTPTLAVGDLIRWRATITPDSTNGMGTFSSTGNYNAMGNPLSLRNGDNFITSTNRGAYLFKKLFYNSIGLINALDIVLLSEQLTQSQRYYSMFDGCSNLVVAPIVPTTLVASQGNNFTRMFAETGINYIEPCTLTTNQSQGYQQMFYNCKALRSAPITFVGEYAEWRCCMSMFEGCSSLVEVPEILPALRCSSSVYCRMFMNCTSLVKAPIIELTTRTEGCIEEMFMGCTSLTTPPPYINLNDMGFHCMSQMFANCTSLTYLPDLNIKNNNSGNSAYVAMNCPNLSYVKCLIEGENISAYQWLYNVSPTGTFVKHPNSTWVSGVSGIPNGWAVEDAIIDE